MDNMISNGRDLVIDLESGSRITSEEDTSKGLFSGSTQLKNVFGRVATRLLGSSGSTGSEHGITSCSNIENSSEVEAENVEFLRDNNYKNSRGGEESEENEALVGKVHVKEKRKKTNFKKAPKPPRPPIGPSLDAADMRMVKEISELAMKKRAKVKRVKALKNMKASKSSPSSNTSLIAMIITLIFFVIILFQGICSRSSSSVSFHGSPESAATTESLISVQFYKNFSTSVGSGPNSASPSSVEQVSGSESRFPG